MLEETWFFWSHNQIWFIKNKEIWVVFFFVVFHCRDIQHVYHSCTSASWIIASLSCLFLECYTDIYFPIFIDCALEKPFEISWGCKVVKWSKRSHLSVIMWCWPEDWQCRGRSNKGSACHRSFLTYIVNALFTVFLLCLLNVLLYN